MTLTLVGRTTCSCAATYPSWGLQYSICRRPRPVPGNFASEAAGNTFSCTKGSRQCTILRPSRHGDSPRHQRHTPFKHKTWVLERRPVLVMWRSFAFLHCSCADFLPAITGAMMDQSNPLFCCIERCRCAPSRDHVSNISILSFTHVLGTCGSALGCFAIAVAGAAAESSGNVWLQWPRPKQNGAGFFSLDGRFGLVFGFRLLPSCCPPLPQNVCPNSRTCRLPLFQPPSGLFAA